MDLPIWKEILRKKLTPEQEISLFLADTALFANLNKRALKEIAGLVHPRSFSEGETVFRQGEAGAGLYLIMEGKVAISSAREGVTMQLAELTKGAFFGELSLFTEDPRTATATAVEDSVLLGFFQPDLKTLIERKPKAGIDIIMSISTIIAQRLGKTNSVLEKAYFKGKAKSVR
ncbi:MAG: cyclic nucleotide-binding domain-containing protein [Leptospira sp.]|nr:cyclic nucleotide-binding domain-containing protein [Leptospira sp.]